MQIPRATYRLQFNEHFRFTDALALVPYLHALGISHVYASPLFKARAHSVHGYDVCDYGQINPEIGTEEDLEKLVIALRECDMGLVLDIVPNHMGVGTAENAWWWDVLKNGRASRYANHFDINWEPADETLRGKVLVPILGDDCEKVLARGELKVGVQASACAAKSTLKRELQPEIVLRYFDNEFPITPNSLPTNFSIERLNSDSAALNELVHRQNYVLTSWREDNLKLNYRRFFAVSTLAAVRVEDENVFNDVHALLKKWIDRKWLDGLRVDHPDGLRDPKKYLERLRALAPDLWIVVEKILQPHESVPGDWPVQGTVGYDFLNQINGLFIESKNEKAFLNLCSEFTGEPADSGGIVRRKKTLVLKTLFVTEINRLVEILVKIAPRHSHQNFPREQWREALTEFAADFGVYRTYIRPDDSYIGEDDFKYIKQAIAKAKKSRPDLPADLFDFLNGLMLLLFRGEMENDFVWRFQQLTSPAMAKGVEDTVFFCFNPFASINEVGGDPGKFGVSAEEFHGFCQNQNSNWPHSMLCSSTHDTKRSEDVRARMNVLSEIPDEWRETVLRWAKINERHRQNNFPDRNMEYLFYQALIGAWPISLERILAYMEKASCEAKQHTDWNNRNAEYDNALKNFVAATLADQTFVGDLEKFIATISGAAQVNSLSQLLVKLAAPGVPDVYQGNELWDFSLVDPDNRRPVDFELRKKLLVEIQNLSPEEIWKRRAEGLPKLWLTQKVLQLRSRRKDLFESDYQTIFANGENANDIFGFIRGDNLIVVVPRFVQHRADGQSALHLPKGNWRNELTGDIFSGEIAAAKLFEKFPVALLVKGE
ncbi:MAG TPA: malto-oligosyltrehalose synthase [Verrucomicrobiae bacterium]|nr:malto-oligosyltrehalose synthase [Verrucomicrobiae bacterium]